MIATTFRTSAYGVLRCPKCYVSITRFTRSMPSKYVTVVSRSASTLLRREMSALDNLHLEIADVASGTQRSVRLIAIHICWTSVNSAASKDKMNEFCSTMATRSSEDQADIVWTPSKALRGKLAAFLESIERSVHPDAKVKIVLYLDGLPEVRDPYTWSRFKGGRSSALNLLSTSLANLNLFINIAIPSPSLKGTGIMTSGQAVTEESHSNAAHPALTPPASGCPLLSLPRELRNGIYSHISVEVVATKLNSEDKESSSVTEEEPRPKITVLGAAVPSLLRVNRQIYDEYAEYMLPRSQLFISLAQGHAEYLDRLDLGAMIPNSVLENIKLVTITFSWTIVMHFEGNADMDEFWTAVTLEDSVDQRSIVCTPAKELRRKLVSLIGRIRVQSRADALTQVSIDLTGFPDVHDPYTWPPFDTLRKAFTPAWKANIMFDRDTLFGLLDEVPITQVSGCVVVPLWNSMARNSADIRANRQAWGEGVMEKVVLPEYENSTTLVQARLFHTKCENGWNGFEVAMSVHSLDMSELPLSED
ncbi:hypothetical protein LTR17_007650 [Elasticomyces elasticus]|nr:hypothetical protein LTR17_007650 [Elasticomyces elasticus]